MTNQWKAVGAVVAQKRISLRNPKVSQAELSRRLGRRGYRVRQQTISNLEAGQAVQWENLAEICAELGLEVRLSVVDPAVEPQTYEGPAELIEVARALNALPPEERGGLLQLLQLFPRLPENRRTGS